MFFRACVVFLVLFVETSTSSYTYYPYPRNSGFELVSQFKNATQISTHGPGVASKAVDGGTNGNYFAHSCTHTLDGSNPWWYVDLEEPTLISKIVIYNRNDCCGVRLNGAVVSVGSDHVSPFTGNTQCGRTIETTEYGNQYEELICFPAIEGQYIGVYIPIAISLSICEMKAYKDIRSPNLLCPKDIVIDSGVNQNVDTVTWSDPSVTDNADINLVATCTPSSGSIFEVGFTKITCSAIDSSGNEGSCSFVVNIEDNEEPTLICPEHITVNNDVDQSEDPVTWSDPTVTDNAHTGMSANCTPASGSIFDVGSTIVTCSATDGTGNEGSCSFVVHFIGQTFISDGPTAMCPHNITVSTDQPLNPITWNDPKVIYNGDADPLVTCIPPSGSSFEVGSTMVTCSATDLFGNEGHCSFSVNLAGYHKSSPAVHGGDKSDHNTSGYVIAVVVLGVAVLVLLSTLIVTVGRYYKNKNANAAGLLMQMEDSGDRLK